MLHLPPRLGASSSFSTALFSDGGGGAAGARDGSADERALSPSLLRAGQGYHFVDKLLRVA
jgi:hypothetical protein